MWQRHTHIRPWSGTCWRIPSGWGSWMMITSHPSVSSSAFILLKRSKISHSSSESESGLPCSALCRRLVTL